MPKIFVFTLLSGAHMRRASAELEKRRASLGATRGLRADGTLDPYHAAILFRDSRGVSQISFIFFYYHDLLNRVETVIVQQFIQNREQILSNNWFPRN